MGGSDSLKQLTRRKLFAAAAITAVPLLASAQQTPAPAPGGTASRDEDLKTARELMASNAAQLAKVEIPISTEPAFVFKVQ
jgi:hypothetical protein